MARLATYLLCVIVAFSLQSCAPVTAPMGLEQASPILHEDFFTTSDGLSLPYRHWDAAKPKAIIVALHGMSDYSRAFEMPGPYWASEGITTYAYDQRSFGKSPNPGDWPGAQAMRQDFCDFIEAVRARHPGVPVFGLGESMGGAVVLTSLTQNHQPHLDGVILVAPAVWSRSDMPFYYRVALWLTAHTFPAMTVSGKGLKIWPSDNIEMLRQNARDPLFQKQTRADAVWGLVNLMDEARKAPLALKSTPPMLVVYGEKDQIIPRAPTEAVVKELGARAEVHVYPKGYHMLLRDLSGKIVWKDIEAFVEKTSAK
ncbi:alpha-beta hydrolase superfamily lysophospholipase [Rhizomicrobium palustre]|uniref:Alpha-beta hydrolase superfamily lysophospholipase n=1 Tax=Rhizomicrobium palustre TaxID=189966 RepID=A0A846N0M6_9PROT|nr:alpha/beta hydrolase [Rhizomicrobium palustre]NIK89049.1 alpha-beta hydrolase superfamily lysophospholipase [Rhizomicrobium palustre]